MTALLEPKPEDSTAEPRSRLGLSLRLWIGCLGGSLASAGGLWWLFAYYLPKSVAESPDSLAYRFGAVLGLGLVVGAVLAFWLDRGVVHYLRDLIRGLNNGPTPRGGSGSAGGWGELSDLAARLEALLTRQRQLSRTAEEYQRLQRQIAAAREAVERWIQTERWRELPRADGPLLALTEALNRGFARQAEVLEQNREAARQVRSDLAASLEDARESAEQAEHTFVEATALLTTVRELQRLAGGLHQIVVADPARTYGAAAQAHEQWRAAAAGAIEELVGAAGESVEHLGTGLVRVQEIAEQVHLLSNRATLIALNAVLAERGAAGPAVRSGDLAEELKRLAREVRAATDRVDNLSQDVTHEVQAASARMRSIRERIVSRLEQAAPSPAAEGPVVAEDTLRLLDRLRETIQDATRGGERLSAAGERVSSAAESLIRKLEDEARDMEGLVVRLSPVESSREPEPS